MEAVEEVSGRWIGPLFRGRWFCVVLVLLAPIGVLSLVPIKPFVPSCYPWPSNSRSLDGIEMSVDYREGIKKTFARVGIGFIERNGVIYIRWLSFFDSDYGLINVEIKLQEQLLLWVRNSPGGISPNGYVYAFPEKLDAVGQIEIARYRECALAEAIVSAENWRPATTDGVSLANLKDAAQSVHSALRSAEAKNTGLVFDKAFSELRGSPEAGLPWRELAPDGTSLLPIGDTYTNNADVLWTDKRGAVLNLGKVVVISQFEGKLRRAGDAIRLFGRMTHSRLCEPAANSPKVPWEEARKREGLAVDSWIQEVGASATIKTSSEGACRVRHEYLTDFVPREY